MFVVTASNPPGRPTGPILLKAAAGDQKDDWLAVRMEDPDHGDIGGICAAARA